MEFIKNIRKLTNEKRISINKMLTDLNLGKSTFATWEKRNTIPSGDVLLKIANYFNVSIDYLLGNTDIKEKPVAQEGDELLDRLRQDPKFHELAELLSNASDSDLDLMISIAKRIDSEKKKP